MQVNLRSLRHKLDFQCIIFVILYYEKSIKILGFILLVIIGFVGGYFLSVDPAKDFYGDWYGAANEGNESFLLE